MPIWRNLVRYTKENRIIQITIEKYFLAKLPGVVNIKSLGDWFLNALRETLAYSELLKYEFYLNLRNFGWESYSNNFIKCLYIRARCILIHNFLELGEICVLKVHRKIR